MRTRRVGAMMAVLIVAVLPSVRPVAGEEDEQGAASLWSGSLGLAYLATSGNTDTQTLGADFSMEREPTPWGLELSASFNRADENGVTTAERYTARGRGTRALGERWGVFGGLSGEKDEFAGYDLLLVVEGGATYNALLGPTHTLSFDGGLTYTDESRIDPEPDVDYLGAVLGLSYQWKLSETASLGERLLYYPNFDQGADWRLSSETALQAALTNRLAVKTSYELRFRNQPIGDNSGTDTTTKVSLVVSF